jgi:hypothetical protein
MKIEIDDEFVSKIVAEDLKWHMNNFKKDIKRAKAGERTAVFSLDKDEDIQEMTRMMDAMKIVLEYYTVPSDE